MRFPVVPQQRGTEGLLAAGPSHHVPLGSQLFKVCGGRTDCPSPPTCGLGRPTYRSSILPIPVPSGNARFQSPAYKAWGSGRRRRIRSCWLISIIITVITNNSDNTAPHLHGSL